MGSQSHHTSRIWELGSEEELLSENGSDKRHPSLGVKDTECWVLCLGGEGVW